MAIFEPGKEGKKRREKRGERGREWEKIRGVRMCVCRGEWWGRAES